MPQLLLQFVGLSFVKRQWWLGQGPRNRHNTRISVGG